MLFLRLNWNSVHGRYFCTKFNVRKYKKHELTLRIFLGILASCSTLTLLKSEFCCQRTFPLSPSFIHIQFLGFTLRKSTQILFQSSWQKEYSANLQSKAIKNSLRFSQLGCACRTSCYWCHFLYFLQEQKIYPLFELGKRLCVLCVLFKYWVIGARYRFFCVDSEI